MEAEMKHPAWHIAVLIPARDEEKLLPRCLHSVIAACRRLPVGVTSDIVVVSDCSQDRTHELAESVLRNSGIVVHTQAGVVGMARALAADLALQRFAGPPERCWLANTDADCEVPSDWLLDQLALARRGVAAVAGIVDVDSYDEHGPKVRENFRLSYRIDADGTHPHVHGANIGIRADAYLAVGGWMNLATAEDHDLWNRLRDSGHRRLSDASLQVVTSGRRIGRAPHGFAGALAAHNRVAVVSTP
jgi:glycosyltransferase involved in cell wall biosynthesis